MTDSIKTLQLLTKRPANSSLKRNKMLMPNLDKNVTVGRLRVTITELKEINKKLKDSKPKLTISMPVRKTKVAPLTISFQCNMNKITVAAS